MKSLSTSFELSFALLIAAALAGLIRWYHPAVFSSTLVTIFLAAGIVCAVIGLWRRPL